MTAVCNFDLVRCIRSFVMVQLSPTLSWCVKCKCKGQIYYPLSHVYATLCFVIFPQLYASLIMRRKVLCASLRNFTLAVNLCKDPISCCACTACSNCNSLTLTSTITTPVHNTYYMREISIWNRITIPTYMISSIYLYKLVCDKFSHEHSMIFTSSEQAL